MFKKKNKSLLLMLVMALMLVSLVACGPKEAVDSQEGAGEGQEEAINVLSIVDDFDNTISLDQAPEKIVSLAPSSTEILFALGLGDKLVGVTEFCDYPEEALDIEKVGGYSETNIEKIIDLEPDLVVSSGEVDKEEAKLLYDAGIQIASFSSGNIAAIEEEILRIGSITGRKEEAEKLVEDMEARKEAIIGQIEEKTSGEEVKVFYEVWHDPITAAGKGSFMDELITLSKAVNIAGNTDSAYPQIDPEFLIDENPQVYLRADDGMGDKSDEIKSRPGFDGIDAIQNDRIFALDGNIVSRPGPRIIEALELVAEAIHGIEID